MKFLLYPFAVLYDLITRVRNYLYDTGRRRSTQFETNVIAVGNLTVGGTGKTPQVEYLIRLLKDRYKVATLSRGYGRKTKGIIIADEQSSATIIGDEPFQYYQKFGKEISVVVGEERALAIPTILLERQEVNVILLDDAYQHRAVRPLLNILLSDYNRPFYKDCLLPAGRLRESRKGADRSDIIVITKCPPEMTEEERTLITRQTENYTKKRQPVFFTSIKYGAPVGVFEKEQDFRNKKVVLFSGLANAKSLVEHIKNNYILAEHIEYGDHYFYKEEDILSIISKFNDHNKNDDHILITTEKDMVKLLNPVFENQFKQLPLFYIPIEIYFLKDKEKFDEIVFKKGIIF